MSDFGFAFVSSPLFGYLDPGTMMFVMQCFVAAVVGAIVSAKMGWTWIQSRFYTVMGRKSKEQPTQLNVVHADAEETADEPVVSAKKAA